MSKKIFKTWFGICDFEVTQSFKTVDAAAKQMSPGPAAVYKVYSDRVRLNFARVKEESYDDNKSLAGSPVASKSSGETKKVSKHENNET
tara:strand:+ start:435 stop:701 length:267 start_codon:yes stop_codon:yes gene_type:complete